MGMCVSKQKPPTKLPDSEAIALQGYELFPKRWLSPPTPQLKPSNPRLTPSTISPIETIDTLHERIKNRLSISDEIEDVDIKYESIINGRIRSTQGS